MVAYHVFTEKELKKHNKELVELHKRVLKTFLVSKSYRNRIRKKFFKLYDLYIDERNIICYFYTPVPLLIRALVLDNLDSVSTYLIKTKKRKRRKRKNT